MNLRLFKFSMTLMIESLVYPTVHCDEWQFNREYSYFRTQHVNSVQAMGTPLHTSTCKSEIHCAWKCWSKNAGSYYFHNSDLSCECYSDLEYGHTDGQTSSAMFKLGRYASVTESNKDNYVKFDVKPGRSDCLELLQDNFQQAGVYVINVNDVDVNVWCHMSDGGWTVIQRRRDGSENFYRAWNDYKNGFGDPTNEHWIGLSHMHALTINPSQLNIILKTFGDREPVVAHVQYDYFSIGSESTAFKLNSSGYTGCNQVDAFDGSNGMGFSTLDEDNDSHATASCSHNFRGAWWFSKCHQCHLNGEYYPSPLHTTVTGAEGISWIPCYSMTYSLKESEMKIRRTNVV